jgi:hypothetical protein
MRTLLATWAVFCCVCAHPHAQQHGTAAEGPPDIVLLSEASFFPYACSKFATCFSVVGLGLGGGFPGRSSVDQSGGAGFEDMQLV